MLFCSDWGFGVKVWVFGSRSCLVFFFFFFLWGGGGGVVFSAFVIWVWGHRLHGLQGVG